jgi:hypothetical protein
MLIAAHHILREDLPHHDLGADYYTRRATANESPNG